MRKYFEQGYVVTVFIIFLLVTLHKLTYASLWYDEAVEYWTSKIMFGQLPFPRSGSTNMYERINLTFQPPLYNFLMFFWLKLGDSEFWFRLSGVLIGFIGMIGLFKSVFVATRSTIASGTSVLVATFAYQLAYYWQECSEYSLMMSSLMWTIYFCLRLTREPSRKNIILFTISSVIPIYSQYGAVFPVCALLVSAFVFILLKKDRALTRTASIAYVCALVFAILPLYLLFARYQLAQQATLGAEWMSYAFKATGNLIDFWNGLVEVLRLNLVGYDSFIIPLMLPAILVVVLAMLVVIVKGDTFGKILVYSCIVSWILYFISVESGYYSYGHFAERYGLCLLPLWIITIAVCAYNIYEMVKRLGYRLASLSYQCLILVLCAVWCIVGWIVKIEPNWEKENNRSVVAAWRSANPDAITETLVYKRACPGFAYYIRQSKDFSNDLEKHVRYLPDLGRDEVSIKDSLNSLFDRNWPDMLYVAATHLESDYPVLVAVLEHEGYQINEVYNNNGELLCFYK